MSSEAAVGSGYQGTLFGHGPSSEAGIWVKLVGARGFEPRTPCAQGRCAYGDLTLRGSNVLSVASASFQRRGADLRSKGEWILYTIVLHVRLLVEKVRDRLNIFLGPHSVLFGAEFLPFGLGYVT
jgi:hypothetical protein